MLICSCKKFVEVDTVTDKLFADQVFENEATANSAIVGIYRLSKDNFITHTTLYNSLASDDIINYFGNTLYDSYRNNTLQVNESTLPWANIYSIIYACNAAIDGLEKSTQISEKSRNSLIGEAKFNRAYCYFYLVNLFGDVPLLMSTDVGINATAPRNSTDEVYQQIIADLTDAQSALNNDYSNGGGERIRVNKWVATAMLARVYLFLNQWAKAEEQATAVINSGLYSLLSSPIGIFQKNNTEAILQWANNSTEYNVIATNFIFTSTPAMICSKYLLNSFEVGDQRKSKWIQSKVYSVTGDTVFYPYKFTSISVGSSEYYTPLRLAEQYLIRAEAKTMQSKFMEAMNDLNLVRLKHGGLTNALPVPANQSQIINLILHERQVEFFTEGMLRWFDLKRTSKIDSVMQLEKPSIWKSTASLYPIPLSDIQRNPNLSQNPGY